MNIANIVKNALLTGTAIAVLGAGSIACKRDYPIAPTEPPAIHTPAPIETPASTPAKEPTPQVDNPPIIISYEIPGSVIVGEDFALEVEARDDYGVKGVRIDIPSAGIEDMVLEKSNGLWIGTSSLTKEGTHQYTITVTDTNNQKAVEEGSIVSKEAKYSEFYGFPERFFEESSLTREQVVKVVDAQYLSLKKMHNGISPYDFVKVEYEPEVYGSTTPYGIKLGDFAFPSLNSGHHRWEVMAHEQGHNFFGGTSWFYYTMAAPHAFLQESLAVLSAFYTYHDILTNQQAYGLDAESIDSLVFDFTNGRAGQEDRYNEYIREGKNFDIDNVLTSQALDFKMITYGENYGWDKFERLTKAFENELGSQFTFLDDGASAIEQSTYIIAALGVAFDQDFRQEFKDLNFPINDSMFEEFRNVIHKYIFQPELLK